MEPRASVIITTYDQPAVLDLTLCAYSRQTCRDYELLIADDGSGPETRTLIESWARALPVPLVHVWQEDTGYEKAKAVNRSVLRSRAPYLIFSDGDCLPSSDFVARHLAAARPGTYIVGGHIRLSDAQTRALTREDVLSGRFERLATRAQRLGLWWVHLKSLIYIAFRKRRKPKFYGMNFSVDRESFYGVNGFDQTYRNAGREDSDLRNRMQLGGVRAKSLWHRAPVFHQEHPRHDTRLIWKGVAEYYNRPDLSPESPLGLRELEAEIASSRQGGGSADGGRE